jgi:hypothetical protein
MERREGRHVMELRDDELSAIEGIGVRPTICGVGHTLVFTGGIGEHAAAGAARRENGCSSA